jgi:exosortase O
MQISKTWAEQTASPAARGLINVSLWALWLWLYRPIFNYLSIIFSREDFRTNQLVLIGALVLIALQVRQGNLRLRWNAAPHLYWPALLLALGGSALFLLSERTLDVNTLSASLFGLATYGLLGLWMEPQTWRFGLPAALLLIGALPFGEHMQTFIGYPVRLLTAALARDGWAALGAPSLGVDTILVFENGVSQVDLPCSGVKSLWTGGLFFLAATWIERRPLNFRWLLSAAVFGLLLLAANVLRVAVLIGAGPVLGWPLLAQMLHVPLGVLGFVAACAAAALMLKAQPTRPSLAHAAQNLPQPAALPVVLAGAFLLFSFLYAPRPQSEIILHAARWQLPAGLRTTPIALKPIEVEWLTRDVAESALRERFEWGGLSGSFMIVTSQSWRAHHRPERCFEVLGVKVDDSRTYLMQADFPLRAVTVSDARGRSSKAVYWFQSATRITDDYAQRIWADVTVRPERWVLVSIVFDNGAGVESPEAQTLILALQKMVSERFAQGDWP